MSEILDTGELDKFQYSKALGNRLYQLRVSRGLSQEKVAHLAGISSYTYQKFENGESRPGTPMNPRLYTLIALARVFDIHVCDLLENIPGDVSGVTARECTRGQ